MAVTKADFEQLAQWCSQPATPGWAYAIGVDCNQVLFDDAKPQIFDGTFYYTPPGASQFLPEHFSGLLGGGIPSTWGQTVNVTLGVGERSTFGAFSWSAGPSVELEALEVNHHFQTGMVLTFATHVQSDNNSYYVEMALAPKYLFGPTRPAKLPRGFFTPGE